MSVDTWKELQNKEGQMRIARTGVTEVDVDAYNDRFVHRNTEFQNRLKLDHINDKRREARELREVWE